MCIKLNDKQSRVNVWGCFRRMTFNYTCTGPTLVKRALLNSSGGPLGPYKPISRIIPEYGQHFQTQLIHQGQGSTTGHREVKLNCKFDQFFTIQINLVGAKLQTFNICDLMTHNALVSIGQRSFHPTLGFLRKRSFLNVSVSRSCLNLETHIYLSCSSYWYNE